MRHAALRQVGVPVAVLRLVCYQACGLARGPLRLSTVLSDRAPQLRPDPGDEDDVVPVGHPAKGAHTRLEVADAAGLAAGHGHHIQLWGRVCLAFLLAHGREGHHIPLGRKGRGAVLTAVRGQGPPWARAGVGGQQPQG